MLTISNLNVKFKDKVVLKNLNLYVPENSIYGFIGINGAGKTTTMKTIIGLLKPDSGEITVNGEKVIYGSAKTNKYIGYLPDVPEFYPFMNAKEFLTFIADISGMDKAESQERIVELLQLVGLENENHRIKGYSRGMKQRLGIAQALLNKPKLLICDEPTSALDPIGRKEILDILKSVSSQTTVLFSTHILSDIERICTDVAVINNGCIQVQGKLNDVKSSYGAGEILIELEKEEDEVLLMKHFDFIYKVDQQLKFILDDIKLFSVLEFISKNKISISKLQKLEPTLESLFMEVVK